MSVHSGLSRLLTTIINDLKRELHNLYGERLVSIVLYGSHARGQAEEGSDIDVVVALKGCADPVSERDKMSELLVDLDLKYDALISVVVVDADELETRETPFLLNVRREGVRLTDAPSRKTSFHSGTGNMSGSGAPPALADETRHHTQNI